MFESGIADTILSAFNADAALKANGSLGVDHRARVVMSPDGTLGVWPTSAAWDRVLLFSMGGGESSILAAQTRGAVYAVTLIVMTTESTPLNCEARNHMIRDAAVSAMLGLHGSTHTWTLGGLRQILVDVGSIGKAEAYQDHPAMLVSETEVSVTVLHS